MPERDWFRSAMAHEDATELLRRQAGNYRMILDRAAALELVLITAAAIDPNSGSCWSRPVSSAQRGRGW